MVKYIYINIFFDILIKRVIKMKEEKLSSKVYSKDFKTKAVGYDVREVDSFLDDLNIEIVKLEREIETLKQSLQTAEAEKRVAESNYRELHLQMMKTKSQEATYAASNANFSNMDLINRVAEIEVKIQKILNALENK